MSAHVLLNSIKELRKSNKMWDLRITLSLSPEKLINSIIQGQEC